MSIARNIRAVRTRNNLTQEEFGEIVGVSSMAVSQWETGRAVPRMGAVQKISDYFHISKGSLIDEDSSTLTKLPISGSTATLPLRTLGKVHAGVMDDDTICDDEEIQVPERVVLAYPDAFLLRVEGNCMDRVIPEGSHVVVVPHKEPTNGSIVVIHDDAYEAIMRRYYKGSSALMLSPDSYEEEYQDIIVHDGQEITLIGVVVWWQASEMME
ncbi:LexA family transcriptional regulator [Fannyhessea vaginae]|uniref:LexA family protein n=1 Tax=Fannyhessea vaginae TaxID=82135 RepID=UPI00204AD40C|nr:XRE family transcriptional regulator [Fannyhessea vaginae]DAK30257.1 MAG TPA: Repressor protein CI [Caudoviricetes sp.]